MRAFLIFALCACALTVDIHSNMFTKAQQQSLAQIKSSKWGAWIVDFAEVHLQTKGPLQELLDAIDELVDDLNAELAELTKNFNRRTDEHNREVVRLNQEISTADREIFLGHDMIDNVLVPQAERIQAQLDQLAANIRQNRQNLDTETTQRENEHEAFEQNVQEHNDAIEAVDECLGLLSQLSNPSLVQIKKIQSNLSKIQNRLKNHNIFTPLVKALVALTTESNFANQALVQEIVDAFNNLRNELVDSLNQAVADEDEAQSNFEDRVRQLNAEHADFQRQVLLRTAELTRTNTILENTEAYVSQRTDDRNTFQAQLDQENDDYAAETDVYQGLVSQYQTELGAADQALTLLTQPSFTDYVNSHGGL